MLKINIVFAFLALLLVAVMANPLQQSQQANSYTIIQLEEACVKQGGMCVHYDDCNPAQLIHMDVSLCPKQKALGATCCYMF